MKRSFEGFGIVVTPKKRLASKSNSDPSISPLIFGKFGKAKKVYSQSDQRRTKADVSRYNLAECGRNSTEGFGARK